MSVHTTTKVLQIIILNALLVEPQHGYSLRAQLTEIVETNTLYLQLQKLAQAEYILGTVTHTTKMPNRTVYTVTNNGKKYVRKLESELQALLSKTRSNALETYQQARVAETILTQVRRADTQFRSA